MREMCSDEYRINDIKAVLGRENSHFQHLLAGIIHSKPYEIQYIQPGQVFDLGDRQFEVLEIQGHTPGSIGLLNNNKEKLVFAGDSIVATPVWLYLKSSLPLRAYWEALKRIDARKKEFDIIYPGHQPTPLGLEYLSDLIACAEEILAKAGIGERTTTFAGEGLLWTHGKGRIIYNPENLI
jgi:glyoxylase-like metal-dependent hydrolase (beta-lactamase superfamily II)